jgi:hypothetical protein
MQDINQHSSFLRQNPGLCDPIIDILLQKFSYTSQETLTVLDLGAGPATIHTKQLIESGLKVIAVDVTDEAIKSLNQLKNTLNEPNNLVILQLDINDTVAMKKSIRPHIGDGLNFSLARHSLPFLESEEIISNTLETVKSLSKERNSYIGGYLFGPEHSWATDNNHPHICFTSCKETEKILSKISNQYEMEEQKYEGPSSEGQIIWHTQRFIATLG